MTTVVWLLIAESNQTRASSSLIHFTMIKYSKVDLGQIEALLNKIGGEKGMMAILTGQATIAYSENVIDLDADPLIPYDGWKVEEHKKGGQFVWNPEKVKLFLHDKQQNGKTIEGNKLRKELANTAVFNANLLDYLLDNPQLIPDEWKVDENGKTRYIFFWGTIYRFSGGDLCVRYLCFDGGHWRRYDCWLGFDWGANRPSAVAAS
jgi:hypothetical protein